METQSKFARRYDVEFKQNAVALVQAGRSLSEVCRDLGCSSWSLGRWVAAAKHGGSQTQPKTLAAESPEQRENRRLRQEIDYLRRQRDILRKSLGHCLRRSPHQRFQLMNELQADFEVEALAQASEVSPSGFYAHQHKARRPRAQADQLLSKKIKTIFDDSRHPPTSTTPRANLNVILCPAPPNQLSCPRWSRRRARATRTRRATSSSVGTTP